MLYWVITTLEMGKCYYISQCCRSISLCLCLWIYTLLVLSIVTLWNSSLMGVLLLGFMDPLQLLMVLILGVLHVDCCGWFPLLRWGNGGKIWKGWGLWRHRHHIGRRWSHHMGCCRWLYQVEDQIYQRYCCQGHSRYQCHHHHNLRDPCKWSCLPALQWFNSQRGRRQIKNVADINDLSHHMNKRFTETLACYCQSRNKTLSK